MAKVKKKEVSDEQFKNQVIFTVKGMQANMQKIFKMFPEQGFNMEQFMKPTEILIRTIKMYQGTIIRNPK